MVIDRIREFIEKRGVSIAEAAEAAGMSTEEMEDALAGKSPMPLEACASLCNRYGVPVSTFLEEDL